MICGGSKFYASSQFCVCIAGYRITDPLADLVFDPTYATATLHVIGKNDIVVLEEWTKILLGVSANKRVEEHDGGEIYDLRFLAESYQHIVQATLFRLRHRGGSSSRRISWILWVTSHRLEEDQCLRIPTPGGPRPLSSDSQHNLSGQAVATISDRFQT